MNRRLFIKTSLKIGAGFSFLPMFSGIVSLSPASTHRSRVVQIVDNAVRQGNSFSPEVLEKMLDDGICALYQTNQAKEVWKNLFSRRETVGIKVNCLSGKFGSTHKILVDVITEKLLQAGVKPGNIIIWDRTSGDLKRAGYSLNLKDERKIRCFGNNKVGFDDRLYINGSVGSLITRTLTHLCDAVINVPVLKDHGITGVTLAMKNFFGAIHNPNKYHVTTGDPYIADLYEMEIIRRKTRLTICDALDAQYEGGPPYKPQWNWPMNGLLLAVDGVALDRVGWEIIERKRKEMGFASLKKVGREPRYILTAGKKGIGQARLDKIDWQKIG